MLTNGKSSILARGGNIQKTHLRLQGLIRKYSFIREYTLLDNNLSTVFQIKTRITPWNQISRISKYIHALRDGNQRGPHNSIFFEWRYDMYCDSVNTAFLLILRCDIATLNSILRLLFYISCGLTYRFNDGFHVVFPSFLIYQHKLIHKHKHGSYMHAEKIGSTINSNTLQE